MNAIGQRKNVLLVAIYLMLAPMIGTSRSALVVDVKDGTLLKPTPAKPQPQKRTNPMPIEKLGGCLIVAIAITSAYAIGPSAHWFTISLHFAATVLGALLFCVGERVK